MSTEAMKLALEALKLVTWTNNPPVNKAITALQEALAEPQPEPVAWMHEWEDGEKIPMLKGRDDRNQDKPKTVRPLVYGDTSPQPAQHACKWPTCQSEQYQQDLAEQIKQELVGRTDQEIVDQTEGAHGATRSLLP